MSNENTILKMTLKLLLQAIIVVLTALLVMKDTALLNQGHSEYSLTEIAQEICIFIAAILFAISAKNDPQSRGFFILVAGLFATIFIRELDAHFDKIQHGFWIYPALLSSLTAMAYARKHRDTVLQPMLVHMNSQAFAYINIGLLIILFFSRVFGSGSYWKNIMGDNYSVIYKTVIQEGIELLGYVLVVYGSIQVYNNLRKR